MSGPVATLDATRSALRAAGIDVFCVKEDTIQLAERVRHHLMDAAVCITFSKAPRVHFTVRVQNSDFQTDSPDEMFARVRAAAATRAKEQGFEESDSQCRKIHDPVDASRILDVWYEVTFSKPLVDLDQLMADVRFALGVNKYVPRT